MGFYGICTSIIAFGLASLLVESFGDIVMIRDSIDRGRAQLLTCVSEDDGAALVVNDDLEAPSDSINFLPNQPWNTPECPINDCLAQWNKTSSWNIVNSAEHPMGPVFDSRWEDFEEHHFPRHSSDEGWQGVINITNSGTVVFSVRSVERIELKLCGDQEPGIVWCSEIFISATLNQASETRSHYSEDPCSAGRTHSKLNQSLTSGHEWRTYVVQWDKIPWKVKTYEVDQSNSSIEIKRLKRPQTSRTSHPFFIPFDDPRSNCLFIRSLGLGRIRFHFYKYILTEKEGSKISYRFANAGQNFCIELLVALCSTCELNVHVIDSNGHKEFIKNISGVNKILNPELLTWQISKLNRTLPKHFQNPTNLEIVTGMTQMGNNGRWAIGNFRKCKPIGAVRKSTTIRVSNFTQESREHSKCYRPIIRCQKLSYNETTIVSSQVQYRDEISSSLKECLRGRGDPSCEFQYPNTIKGRSICNPSGCICASGFLFAGCESACDTRKHGYNCKESCKCWDDEICDKSTGACSGKCNDDQSLPPYCETKLTAPAVDDIADTTALLYYPAQLDWGKANKLSYEINTTNEVSRLVNATLGDTSNLRMFETRITHLAPETIYIVRAEVGTTRSPGLIKSPITIFATNCTPPSIPLNLEVMTWGNGVVSLGWDYPQHFLTESTRFKLSVISTETRLQMNLSSTKEIVREIPVTEYRKNYPLTLNLAASTEWNSSVTAINKCGLSTAATKSFCVLPSVGFRNGEKPEFTHLGTSITMKIPAIVNTTRDTVIKIIITGLIRMKIPVPRNLRRLLNITNSEEGCVAGDFSARESKPEYLKIGMISASYSSEKCDVHPTETYKVVVVAVDEFEKTLDVLISSTVYPPCSSSWGVCQTDLIWLLIFPLLLICSLSLFCLYRKHRNNYGRMKSLPPVQYYDDVLSLPRIDKEGNDWLYDCCPHPVELTRFENRVQMAVKNGELESEFAMLPKGLVRPCHSGSLPENKSKNRSQSLIAYDDTRVKLGNYAIGYHSDYINANYIQGYCKEKAYIATQGPKSDTVVDFWKMIWQEEVLVICMLVNVIEDGKYMCEKYWPEIGKSVEHGHVTILNLNHRVYSHYTYRTFQLTTQWGTESRKVKHLQYTGWPKQGVPMYSHSIVEYLNELRATPIGPGPIVVHCSTGTGRTGTIILCDICLRYTAAEGMVNLFAMAMKMYEARANMLDNLQQYILAHLMPTQCLLLLPTNLPCSDISLANIEDMKKDLPAHMRRLGVSSWKDKALYPLEPLSLPRPEHLAKNRFPKFAPIEHSLVKLKRYPKDDSSSEYISAISVDGIMAENQYLASQLPLPSTLSDFWRLVAEKKVELVIVLQRPDPSDVSCTEIIPRDGPFNPVPYITVETKIASDSNDHFTTDQLLLTDTSEKYPRTQKVTVLTCNNWGLAEDAEPPPPETLVSLWSASEKVSRTQGPTLVICHDGVTGCGLYVALSVLLERMAVEQECDVILAVRVIRRARAEFVYTKAQFEYLYDAAMNFAEEFQTYSNFT